MRGSGELCLCFPHPVEQQSSSGGVGWDCPGLCKLPAPPKTCYKSSCRIEHVPAMGSRFLKAPGCCDVLGEDFLGHGIPPDHHIQPTGPCPCSALKDELFPPMVRVLKVPITCRYRDMDVTHGSCATLGAQPSGVGTRIWRPKSSRNLGQARAETPRAHSPTALQGQKVVPLMPWEG